MKWEKLTDAESATWQHQLHAAKVRIGNGFHNGSGKGRFAARVMGRLTLPRSMLVVGWLATSVMALATVGFFLL